MKTFYTYLHCKPNGDPFYVGKGFGNRSNKLAQRNQYHKNIIAKYGVEIFVFPCESEEQAFADEIQQIAQLRQAGFELCNQTDGGEGISNPAKEVRIKISNSRKGIAFSAEHRHNLSIARRGRIITPETRAKQAISLKGNTNAKGNKNCVGRKVSEQTRRKMFISRMRYIEKQQEIIL
jgi:hypothetical protein